MVESELPPETLAWPARLGHPVVPVAGHGRATFGRGQVIYRDPDSGVLWGGSDPRADGCAMSL